MKILLVYPNRTREIIGFGDLGAIAEPLALEYLSAGARADGHDVQILDLRLHPHDLRSTLLVFQPDLVGVTGYSMHVLRMLEICRSVKAELPTCVTVCGGHHATLMPEDFCEPEVDLIVQGEGVGPLRRILAYLNAGHAHAELAVPGVWVRAGDEHRAGAAPAPFAIDEVPPPDREVTRADRASYFIDWMQPIALLRTSVGCPYRCSFCSLWKVMDGRYHTREVERVVDEIASVPERYVFFVDDEPFVNPRRMAQLAQAIRARGIDKEYFAYCRVDSFVRDRALMQAWREAGLRRVFFGIEAVGDQELLDFNKRQKTQQVVEALRTARELDLSVLANFIVNPRAAPSDFERLVRFIEDNQIDYPTFTILTPLPGTAACESFDQIIERQPNGRPNWALFDLQLPVTQTRLPREEFLAHYNDLYKVFASHRRAHGSHEGRLRSGSGPHDPRRARSNVRVL
jgi:radical SAM superfamily enzyme YgiQ (UPF0313 family)